MSFATRALCALTCVFIIVFAALPLYANLLTNGDFQTDANQDGWPDGWRKGHALSAPASEGNRWLKIDGTGSTQVVIPVQEDWQTLSLSCRMRMHEVVVGDANWKTARLAMEWRDKQNKRVGSWPKVLNGSGSSDWQDFQRDYEVPRGAVSLVLSPANFGQSGTVEFDDLMIELKAKRQPLTDLPLPPEAGNEDDIWSQDEAWKATSATRDSICLNGLWRFLPAHDANKETAVPAKGEGWGWFKVPGVWPGHWRESEHAQDLLLPAQLKEEVDLSQMDQAWYQRTISIPADWNGRQIVLAFEMLNTHCSARIDGTYVGELYFPNGELDITRAVTPGNTHLLDLLITARPLSQEGDVFMAADRAFKSKASVKNKGITGDLFLISKPQTAHIEQIQLEPSVTHRSVTIRAALENVDPTTCLLSAQILDSDGKIVKEAEDLAVAVEDSGRISSSFEWVDPILWDTHNPYLYTAKISLTDKSGQVLDQSLPITFGFREIEIRGKDLFLNGTPIHLRAIQLRNPISGAGLGQESRCEETFAWMRKLGFNFLITGNYGYSAGSLGDPESFLRAADKNGMLVSWSLPHIGSYGKDLTNQEAALAYQTLTERVIRAVQNHPSIIMYAMNHNATGYKGDQNPLHLDGLFNPNDTSKGRSRNTTRESALLAQEIARTIDTSRPIYHHSSGNLGQMHTLNIYLNWAPRQERADWLEQWSMHGTKPIFFVEWGLPHIASFSSYRGPSFIWRTKAWQQFWDAEFAAAIFGDSAYEMTPDRQNSMATQQKQWKQGNPISWPALIWKSRLQEENVIGTQAWYAGETWKGHRFYGASAMLPWDQDRIWVENRREKAVVNEDRYQNLKQPGIVADRYMRESNYNPDLSRFELTSLGKTFLRWNQPVIAWLGGKPEHPTEQGNIFEAGDSIRQSLVLVNDSRIVQQFKWSVSMSLPDSQTIIGKKRVEPGAIAVIPLMWQARQSGNNDFQTGTITASIEANEQVLPIDGRMIQIRRHKDMKPKSAITIGVLGKNEDLPDRFRSLKARELSASDSVDRIELLIIPRHALQAGQTVPAMRQVRDGLRVLVLEQTADYLQNQLGFRVQEHQIRRVFPRMADHPVLKGLWALTEDQLHDWQGEATSLPQFLDDGKTSNPKWYWAGYENTRVWRSSRWGTVASVLIEKPPVGDFRAIVDGGYDLQYAPLLEFRAGKGCILFCQLDVTGRTQAEPTAEALLQNMLDYLMTFQPDVPAKAEDMAEIEVMADAKTTAFLKTLGYAGNGVDGTIRVIAGSEAAIKAGSQLQAVEQGKTIVAIGQNQQGLDALFPERFTVAKEGIFPQLLDDLHDPLLTGINNGDLYWPGKLTCPSLKETPHPALHIEHHGQGTIVLLQPTLFPEPLTGDKLLMDEYDYWRKSQRRFAWFVSQLLRNAGARPDSGLLDRFSQPAGLYNVVLAKWQGKVDRENVGRAEKWFAPNHGQEWPTVKVPGSFDVEANGLSAEYNGFFWYRTTFPTPVMTSDEPVLEIGAVDDESWIWLNGEFLGEVTRETNPKDFYKAPRTYVLKPGMLNANGINTLVILANDTYLSGGLTQVPRLTSPGPWLNSHYAQVPKASDDPYRYYRW